MHPEWRLLGTTSSSPLPCAGGSRPGKARAGAFSYVSPKLCQQGVLRGSGQEHWLCIPATPAPASPRRSQTGTLLSTQAIGQLIPSPSLGRLSPAVLQQRGLEEPWGGEITVPSAPACQCSPCLVCTLMDSFSSCCTGGRAHTRIR